jgi:16S rRNA processing protein RimM
VGAPFGLKGFVKVKPLSGETGHFSRLRKVTLRQGNKDETWELAETIIQGDSLIVRFAGVESPEAAALLKGAELIAEREFAAPLKEGEFYVEDLKGLEVIDGGGETLGHISNVMEGGGAFLAEVKLSSGDTSLVPFRNEFFGEVNLDLGKIVLLEPWILE